MATVKDRLAKSLIKALKYSADNKFDNVVCISTTEAEGIVKVLSGGETVFRNLDSGDTDDNSGDND